MGSLSEGCHSLSLTLTHAFHAVLEPAEPSPRQLLEVAARVCSDRQLEALVLYETVGGLRKVAERMGVSTTTARDHVVKGLDKVYGDMRV
jgi:hypothetical protein